MKTHRSRSWHKGQLTNQHGFTLAELLITSTVFTIVVLAMGSFYAFTLLSYDEGCTKIDLPQNGFFAIEEIAKSIREARVCSIPADGEPPGTNHSITAVFPPEPYDDENRNHQWDNIGATGPCAPKECFTDLNGNGEWDSEIKPAISFRVSERTLQNRTGSVESDWKSLLDNCSGYSSGRSCVSVEPDALVFIIEDSEDPHRITIRLTIRDDMNTEDTDDDLVKNFQISTRSRG